MSETLEGLMKQHINKTEQDGEEAIDQEALKKRYLSLKKEYDKTSGKLEHLGQIAKEWVSLGDGIAPKQREKMISILAERLLKNSKNPLNMIHEIVAYSRLSDLRYEMGEILRKLGIPKIKLTEGVEDNESGKEEC
jgi:hypothetical protein